MAGSGLIQCVCRPLHTALFSSKRYCVRIPCTTATFFFFFPSRSSSGRVYSHSTSHPSSPGFFFLWPPHLCIATFSIFNIMLSLLIFLVNGFLGGGVYFLLLLKLTLNNAKWVQSMYLK